MNDIEADHFPYTFSAECLAHLSAIMTILVTETGDDVTQLLWKLTFLMISGSIFPIILTEATLKGNEPWSEKDFETTALFFVHILFYAPYILLYYSR